MHQTCRNCAFIEPFQIFDGTAGGQQIQRDAVALQDFLVLEAKLVVRPIGCTGARMIVTMMNELERTDSRYGVVAMCAAGGMGSATVIERV